MRNLEKSLKNSRKYSLYFLLMLLFASLISIQNIQKDDAPLSSMEKEGLVYTIEEARLAQNVNSFLFDKWEAPSFEYVMNDETNNMYKFQKLIKRQGGADPLEYAVYGKFNITSMQDIYNKYKKIGKNSLLSGYYVSMTLEEQNYVNMEKRIGDSSNSELIKLYNNRLSDIGNHIRVLNKHMKKLDVAYEAQFMSKEKFNNILNQNKMFNDISL